MSTLLVIEEVLRERGTPMVVREIVVAAAERLPTKSKTPDTVVARDLAMDIKRRGDESKFTRVAPGRYTLRALVGGAIEVTPDVTPEEMVAQMSQQLMVHAEGSAPPELSGS